MHDHGEVAGLGRELRHGLVAGLAHVHDERQPDAPRELYLRAERGALRVARREVAVEVEADLPHRDHPRSRRELLELRQRGVVQQVRLVRVQTDGGVHAGQGLGEVRRPARRLEVDADGDDLVHAGGPRLGDRAGGVGDHLEVAVRVDEVHGLADGRIRGRGRHRPQAVSSRGNSDGPAVTALRA